MDSVALIADIGGTNLRVALVNADHEVTRQQNYLCRDFATLTDALQAYLDDAGLGGFLSLALLSAAGPVLNGRVRMTNHPWDIDAAAISTALSIRTVELLNDFEAIAWSLHGLEPGDVRSIQSGTIDPNAPTIVIGPGTGLGVAAFIPGHGPLATEGGHMTLAATTSEEWQIAKTLTEQYGHASFERVVSGMGLETLYRISTGSDLNAAEITTRAEAESDPAAIAVVRQFSVFLGAVAADMTLAYGARGGVYLAGGILPKVIDIFPAEAFIARFTAKGRFGDYLRNIPVHIITHPNPALQGLRTRIATTAG